MKGNGQFDQMSVAEKQQYALQYPRCDGCNELMDWEEYKTHDCPAYAGSNYLNPWDHKMKVAQWKIPKVRAELRAKGSSRPASIFQRVVNWCLNG